MSERQEHKKMADYISREAAISEILSEPADVHYPSWYAEKLEDIPAAAVVEKTEWDKLMFLVDAANQILEAAKWISVKERLPERPDNWPHCAIRRCYFLVALESGCVESLGFDFREMRWHSTGSPVTHWMPLPEPPKEGGGEDG